MTCSSTAVSVKCDDEANLKKRACAREACCSTSQAPVKQCCDEECLFEIARRDCKKEHASAPSASVPLPADEEPCESHLADVRSTYGDILKNIGCICKVLLSMNLESCCATKSYPLKKKTSWQSDRQSLLDQVVRRNSSGRLSVEFEQKNSCPTNACCSSTLEDVFCADEQRVQSPPILANPQPGNSHPPASTMLSTLPPSSSVVNHENTLSANDCCIAEKKTGGCCTTTVETGESCCSEKPTKDTHLHYQSDSYKDSCTKVEVTGIFQNGVVAPCDKMCCENPAEEDTAGLSSKQGAKEYSPRSSPLGKRGLNMLATGLTISDCAADDCCGSQNVRGNILQELVISPAYPPNYDIESGQHPVEHLIISVQGMTCTGCETNLYKTLTAISGVSHVKTSLVLARAEFDISTTTSRSAVDIVKDVSKKTGFVCALMSETGHYLDLIVDDPGTYTQAKSIPDGVSNIEVMGSQIIRVSYLPQIIGARDMMENPFFNTTKLAPLADPPLIVSGREQLWLMLFKTLLSTALTIPVLVMAWARLPPREVAYGAASLVLATIVQVYIAGPWYVSAFKALVFSRLIEVDFLVVLSSSTAYIYSIIAYGFLASEQPLSTEGFFETSTLLVTLIMLGRFVTTLARQRAVESISIQSLQATTAVLVDGKNGQQKEIDSRLLQYGDMFVVLPGSSIVTDGTVEKGTSDVDESMITGEATLISKRPGSPVVAGSINHQGTLIVRLTRLTGDNTIKAIGLMVDEAKSSKAKFQEMADRIAGVFVPIILVVTGIVFVTWFGVGKGVRGYSTSQTCINAMTYAISALIVSCPCAIGLAVPMVLVIAGGVAAKHGVIFKSAETIEKARKTNHVVFDKTGTLTSGLMTVVSERYPNRDGTSLAPMILGLASSNQHPVSAAITMHLTNKVISDHELSNLKSVPGCGVEATWGEDHIRAGNPYWLGIEKLPAVKEVLSQGMTVFCVTVNKGLVAVFGLKDTLQPEALTVVNELKRRGITMSILSGDHEESIKAVAIQLGISQFRSRCSPADKQAYIKSISTPDATVMFCGDGTNDAVALTEAAIGIHVNGGTDIAKSAADAVLIRPSLIGIITLMDLSKAFYRRVVFNFAWSFVYNTFAILLAAGAFPNVRIEPQYAGLGEIVSVLPVIAVGVQLRWAKFTEM